MEFLAQRTLVTRCFVLAVVGGSIFVTRATFAHRWFLGSGSRPLPAPSGAKAQSKQSPALRGTLCSIPRNTTSLRSIKRCSALGLFYTSELNIPDHEFTTGFPGITDRTEWFSINYAGRFSVQKPGRYKFRLTSDDGSLLWIDAKMVIDNDGAHRVRSRQGTIELEAGLHVTPYVVKNDGDLVALLECQLGSKGNL